MPSWDIIVWAKENAIDYVPSIWANETKTLYKYPCGTSDTRKRQIIYDCIDLVDNFTWCDAIVKKKNKKQI